MSSFGILDRTSDHERPGDRSDRRDREAIAIIGMSCLYPGAPNLDTYWRNILGKVDAISDPPPGSWDPERYYDPSSDDTDRVYCKRGGYLGDLVSFDPLAHGIPPVSVGGEPDQWIALQLARDALADAGYAQLEETVRRRTAVILGKGTYLNGGNAIAVQHGLVIGQTLQILKTLHPEYSEHDLEVLRRELQRGLPPINAETVPGLIPNVIVGRIANRLDLMGPTYTVDAACASSLVAIQLAQRDLLGGECDLAIVGGTQVWMPLPALGVFCRLGALSRREQIRPFDKDADGTLLGEGVGMLVLKRLSDAERDDDRIYAVIRGVGVASDGRGVGVMAPRVEGEELALRRAYESAGIDPRTVGLIEAHGTATAVGDATELEALSRVFGSRRGGLPTCALGSVKSMISHTIPAAGAAGTIKAALALYHKVLPPTLHCDQPNPKLDLDTSVFYISGDTRPWIHGTALPRRAGVNAFGFGGINAHVVLEEYRPAASLTEGDAGLGNAARTVHAASPAKPLSNHLPEWDSEVVILEAASPAGLLQQVRHLEDNLDRAEAAGPVVLKDVSYTLSRKLTFTGPDQKVRLSIVATSMPDLRQKLAKAVKRLSDPSCRQIRDVGGIYYAAEPLGSTGKIAFLVPGEGAQYPNMLADLCLHFPEVREHFDQVDRLYAEHPRGYLSSDYIFPRTSFRREDQEWAERHLWQMDGAIESVLIADQALLALLGRLKIRPDMIVGHSSGEYAALKAAGVLDLRDQETTAWFSRELNRVYEETVAQDGVPRAVLVAVGADRAKVEEIAREVGGELFVAMDNCPHQVVIIAERTTIDRVLEVTRRDGLITETLTFDRPYHTPLFILYTQLLKQVIDKSPIRSPLVPVYSCTSTGPFPDDPAAIRTLMLEHWVRPVEFRRTVERLHDEGVRLFVEAGPRGNLTTFVEDILRGRPFCAVPANVQRRSGITQLNHLVGLLAAHGVSMDLNCFYERRSPQLIDWESAGQRQTPARPESLVMLETGFPPLRVSEEIVQRLRSSTRTVASQAQTAAPAAPAAGHQQPLATAPPRLTPAPANSPVQPSPDPIHSANGQPSATSPNVHVNGTGHGTGIGSAIESFLHTMDQFLVVQEQVMRGFLRAEPGAWSPPPSAAPVINSWPASLAQNGDGPTPEPAGLGAKTEPPESAALVEPPQPTTAPAAPPSDLRERISSRLIAIVGERTGYPTEMIDFDLDLEADLGIDSIKRVEIFGSFRREFHEFAELDLERLTALRTLRQIVDSLVPEVSRGVPIRGADEAVPAILPAVSGAAASLTASPNAPTAASSLPAASGDLRERVGTRLIAIVGERTGYPTEMIDFDLDLEADLGIDSIKRVEIFGSFRREFHEFAELDLERLTALRTLRQIVDSLVTMGGPGSSSTTPASPSAFPMLGEILSHIPGQEVVARRTFDPADDLYLFDHTLGRSGACEDSGPDGLPIMPLTMSLEILAEAAAFLANGRFVVELRDVNAYRWIAFDDQPQTLQVIARRVPENANLVRVQLRNLTEDEQAASPARSPVVEATAVLAEAYPAAPPPTAFRPRHGRPSRFSTATLYDEGMFHGPSWQGVSGLDVMGDDGVIAGLSVLPFDRFLRTEPDPRYVLDPVVLDAAGQLIGFWTMEHLTSGRVVFPFHLDALDVFGPNRPPGERLTASAMIRRLDERQIRSDIEVVGHDGRLWMRLTGWDDKRFDLPSRYTPLIHGSSQAEVSESWPEPISGLLQADRLECRRLSVTIPSDRGFWKRVWANRVLGRDERALFAALNLPEERQLLWLAGQTAAKEAVQRLLRVHHGLDPSLPEIEIRPDLSGRLTVDGLWREAVDSTPVVSVAYAEGTAVALAGLPAAPDEEGRDPSLRIAVAAGSATDPLADPAEAAFAHEPHVTTDLSPTDREVLRARWQCARRALAELLGEPAADTLAGLRAVDFDAATGMLSVELPAPLGETTPDLVGSPLTVFTTSGVPTIAVTCLESAGAALVGQEVEPSVG